MENDLRVLKTKKAIREAFIALVEEKGYRHVTVSDITKRATINRNTFYLHYMDKEDLISSLMQESVARQGEKMKILTSSVNVPDLTEITQVFRSVLNIIFEEIEFYRILLTDESLRGNINPLRKLWKQSIVHALPESFHISPLALEFACTGSFGVVEQWIIYDTAPINDTAKVLAALLIRCLQPLEG
ncbi:MAG: TetR/AcrR family transcriptional regulator [Clostridia bacterium]|nr:TetR/AcrR family transcriptional regulator [Clostridia bacterium]